MKRIVFILMLVAVVLLPGFASAAGVTVTPAVIERRVDPGQSIEITVTITNEDENPATLYPSVRDVIGMNEDSAPIFAPLDYVKTGGELSSYVKFARSSITLGAGEKTDVVATVTLPLDAPQGGTFGLIGVTKTPPTGVDQGTSVAVGFQTGALVGLRIGADAIDDAKILEFRADNWIKGSGDTTFLTRIENTGTAMVRPYGVIEIRDVFGRLVASESFNSTKRGIMPKATAKFDTNWAPGKQLIGRFEATLAATYGEGVKKSLVQTTTFWVFPLKLTLIVLAIAAALFLGVYVWVRGYVRRALKGAGVETAPRGSVSFFAVFISIVAVAAIIIGIVFFLLA